MCIRDSPTTGMLAYEAGCSRAQTGDTTTLTSTDRHGMIAVSYTHLDVYKRQELLQTFLSAAGYKDRGKTEEPKADWGVAFNER